MSDARTRELVRRLKLGDLHQKDRAVELLIRDGSSRAEAQREVWGLAEGDVLTCKTAKGGRHHLIDGHTNKTLVLEEGVWTYPPAWTTFCGRTSADDSITLDHRTAFKLHKAGPGENWWEHRCDPAPTSCRSCSGITWKLDLAELQGRQAVATRRLSWACLRGNHAGWPCRWCLSGAAFHVPMFK